MKTEIKRNDFKKEFDGSNDEIITENEPILYDFIESAVESISNHSVSSKKQIKAICVFDISNIIATAGIRETAHYLFDFSSSGSGKDSSADLSRDIFLRALEQQQEDKRKTYYADMKDDKELVPKIFSNIHGADITVQSIAKAYEANNHQCVRRGEIGQLLKDDDNELIMFIVANYGKNTIDLPKYIKNLGSNTPAFIKSASLSFYGNSNLAYLNKKTFQKHMSGGLLNRCIMLFEDYIRPFDDRPNSFSIEHIELSIFQRKSNLFFEYCKSAKKHTVPKIAKTDKYIEFDRKIYAKEVELKGSIVQDIHKRTMQNLRAIIYTFHYVECFERDFKVVENLNLLDEIEIEHLDKDNNKITCKYSPSDISDECISKAVDYMCWLTLHYDKLILEAIGINEDIRKEDLTEKIIAYGIERLADSRDKNLPFTLRDLYKRFHISKKELLELLEGRISFKKTTIEWVG